MKQNHIYMKSALAIALLCALPGLTAQAQSTNERYSDKFSLGTQPEAGDGQQQNGDDSKFSPNLYQIKKSAGQERAAQEGISSRTKRSVTAVQENSALNLDIIIDGSIDDVRGSLSDAGFNLKAVYGNSVGGTISPDGLGALSKIPAVRRINLPEVASNAGSVDNQADFVQLSKRIKSSLKNAPTGKGLTIGILSTSYDCLNQVKNPNMPDITAEDDVNNGELPDDVYVVKEVGECTATRDDEGRAMAQLVHDIAPDAKIAFYAPDTITDFAQGIQTLALPKGQFDALGREGAGANIIVDDLYFYAEPYYEIGIIGESVTSVVERGIPYFVSAGNFTMNGKSNLYHNSKPQFVPFTPVQDSVFKDNNAQILQFGDAGNDTTLPVTLKGNKNQRIGIWWDQSYTQGNKSDIVACLTKTDGKKINNSNWCSRPPLGQDPMILLNLTLPKNVSGGDYGLQIFYNGGVIPGSITVMGYKNVVIDSRNTSQGTVYGHSATPAAFTLGAADFASTPQCNADATEIKMESFSSFGNSPLLFDASGKSIFMVPNKPDATAIDGVSNSFFGRKIANPDTLAFKHPACNYTSSYAFYGTSAAAPNAAATAALIMQDNPGITPKNLYDVMRKTATTIGKKPTDSAYNYISGYGLINAEKSITTLREKRSQ